MRFVPGGAALSRLAPRDESMGASRRKKKLEGMPASDGRGSNTVREEGSSTVVFDDGKLVFDVVDAERHGENPNGGEVRRPSSAAVAAASLTRRRSGIDDAESVASRNALGSVSIGSEREYMGHVLDRRGGRDLACGFDSPAGVDYAPIGGKVPLLSGEDLLVTSFPPDEPPPRIHGGKGEDARRKIAFELNQTIVYSIRISKFAYFELDMGKKPLESAPFGQLHLTLECSEGEPEMFCAMSDKHQYADEANHQWRLPPNVDGDGNRIPPKEQYCITILPVDVEYLESKTRKLAVSIRGVDDGKISFTMRAFTVSYTAGIKRLLRERELFSGREAERRRAQVRAMKLSINQSTVRKQIARAGLLPPAVDDRPLTSSAIGTQSSAQPFRTVQETLHFLHESHRNIRANEGLTQKMNRIESLVAADEHWHSHPSTDGLVSSATSKSLFLSSTAGGGDDGKRGGRPGGEQVVVEEEEEDEEASEEEEEGEESAGDGGLRAEMIRDENALSMALYVHYKESMLLPSSYLGPPSNSASRRASQSGQHDAGAGNRSPTHRHSTSPPRSGHTSPPARSPPSRHSPPGQAADGTLDMSFLTANPEDPYVMHRGVNVPTFIGMSKGMGLIGRMGSTLSKRDINRICREVFRDRGTTARPPDHHILLNLKEFRTTIKLVTHHNGGRPIFETGTRPPFIDPILWQRLKDDNRPEAKLRKLSSIPDFNRRAIKSFGNYDSNSDGFLARDEFFALCNHEIRINRRDATEILGAYNLAGNDRKGQLDLATFTKVFGLANTSIPDERDTAARQEMSLTSFYRRQLAEESSYTMPAEEVARRKKDITRYQARLASTMREGDPAPLAADTLIRAGVFFRKKVKNDPSAGGEVAVWEQRYCVLRQLTAGAVLQCYTKNVDPRVVAGGAGVVGGEESRYFETEYLLEGTHPATVLAGGNHEEAHRKTPPPTLTKVRALNSPQTSPMDALAKNLRVMSKARRFGRNILSASRESAGMSDNAAAKHSPALQRLTASNRRGSNLSSRGSSKAVSPTGSLAASRRGSVHQHHPLSSSTRMGSSVVSPAAGAGMAAVASMWASLPSGRRASDQGDSEGGRAPGVLQDEDLAKYGGWQLMSVTTMKGEVVVFKIRGARAEKEAFEWVDAMRMAVNRDGLESYETVQTLNDLRRDAVEGLKGLVGQDLAENGEDELDDEESAAAELLAEELASATRLASSTSSARAKRWEGGSKEEEEREAIWRAGSSGSNDSEQHSEEAEVAPHDADTETLLDDELEKILIETGQTEQLAVFNLTRAKHEKPVAQGKQQHVKSSSSSSSSLRERRREGDAIGSKPSRPLTSAGARLTRTLDDTRKRLSRPSSSASARGERVIARGEGDAESREDQSIVPGRGTKGEGTRSPVRDVSLLGALGPQVMVSPYIDRRGEVHLERPRLSALTTPDDWAILSSIKAGDEGKMRRTVSGRSSISRVPSTASRAPSGR